MALVKLVAIVMIVRLNCGTSVIFFKTDVDINDIHSIEKEKGR